MDGNTPLRTATWWRVHEGGVGICNEQNRLYWVARVRMFMCVWLGVAASEQNGISNYSGDFIFCPIVYFQFILLFLNLIFIWYTNRKIS
jgi:hypothetical protein